MRILGLDLGSRAVKMALMVDGNVTLKKSWHTAYFYKNFCKPVTEGVDLGISLEALGVEAVDYCVSTGYGRNNTNLSGFTSINELKAHFLGAQYQIKESNFILLDVGGQDVKVMRIKSGQMMDMNLNDKCAASCGRFLEQMAEVLDMPLQEMTSYTESPVALSSTCAVFCESELIGKMAEGHSTKDLAAGVNQSLFKRLTPILKGFEHEQVWLSGGVSNSLALKTHLLTLYEKVDVLEEPVFNGAIGCCIFAKNSVDSKKGR